MDKVKKYLPVLLTIAGLASTYLSPAVQAFYAHHPGAVATIAAIYAKVMWALPSPLQK